MKENKLIIIGMDQSYKNTGISIVKNNKLVKVTSIHTEHYNNKSDVRRKLSEVTGSILNTLTYKYIGYDIKLILEQIRLHSGGFINIDYIKSIGALNSCIVDKAKDFNINVYSVDTRAWKSQVIGTTKKIPNKFGVPEEKWTTVQWVIQQGFEKSILEKASKRKTKGVFIKDGIKYQYNHDAADSAGIAMFGVLGNKSMLKLES